MLTNAPLIRFHFPELNAFFTSNTNTTQQLFEIKVCLPDPRPCIFIYRRVYWRSDKPVLLVVKGSSLLQMTLPINYLILSKR